MKIYQLNIPDKKYTPEILHRKVTASSLEL